jgi:hypothetical protein
MIEKVSRNIMFDTHGKRGSREYLWFALLLIVVLATSAVHSSDTNAVSTRHGAVAP